MQQKFGFNRSFFLLYQPSNCLVNQKMCLLISKGVTWFIQILSQRRKDYSTFYSHLSSYWESRWVLVIIWGGSGFPAIIPRQFCVGSSATQNDEYLKPAKIRPRAVSNTKWRENGGSGEKGRKVKDGGGWPRGWDERSAARTTGSERARQRRARRARKREVY